MKNSALTKTASANLLDIVPDSKLHSLSVNLQLPLDRRLNLILKRSVDLFISSILLLFFFSWLFLLIALLIKLDSKGPVFFFQKRHKRKGKLFTCIKFRTMVVNADAHTRPAMVGDARITRIGKFLRLHHLDELPQLLNVWWGDMSMIGPRPYMISDNEKFGIVIKQYYARHRIKPGITGLAQVHGYVGPVHEITDIEKRINKDLFYIHHWSPLLDIKIFFRTFLKVAGVKV